MNTVLIVGATGVIGEAALHHFAADDRWQAIAVSRRTPEPPGRGSYLHLPLDLSDSDACRRASVELSQVTHVIYAAVTEKPGLVAGWQDPAQMQLNLAMLQNLLDPLCDTAGGLKHISLLQGAKAYGGHVGHTPPLPAREAAPRDAHENFYWLQEDYVREKSAACGFAWTVFRPQVVIGAAVGAAMNPLLPLAAYAAIRKVEGKPFSYPGGELQIGELVDAALLAAAFEWAATDEAATNQIFNITNGDVFAWRDAWPTLAAAFDMDTGPDEPMRLSDYLLQRSDLWDRIVGSESLRAPGLPEFLGQSHHYIDILLRSDATTIQRPTLLSTIKLRKAGFARCVDSYDALQHWVGVMRARRLIP